MPHKNNVQNDAPRMRGPRGRNKSGALRQKRSDTHIGTLEHRFNINLGVRSDMHLGAYLKKNNLNSVNNLITGK